VLHIWARLEDPYAAPSAPDTGPAPAYRPPSTLAFSGRRSAAGPPQASQHTESAARLPASMADPAKAQVSQCQTAQRNRAMLKGLCNAHRETPPLSTACPRVQVTQLVVSAPAIAVAAACGSNSGAGPVPLTLSLDQQQQQWQAMQQQLQRQQQALTEAQLAAATAQQQQLQQWQQQSQWLQQQQWQTQQHLQQQQPQAQQQQLQQASAPYKKERHTGIKVRQTTSTCKPKLVHACSLGATAGQALPTCILWTRQ
jgi:CRISPR-associated protein (Cas_Cmr3)